MKKILFSILAILLLAAPVMAADPVGTPVCFTAGAGYAPCANLNTDAANGPLASGLGRMTLSTMGPAFSTASPAWTVYSQPTTPTGTGWVETTASGTSGGATIAITAGGTSNAITPTAFVTDPYGSGSGIVPGAINYLIQPNHYYVVEMTVGAYTAGTLVPSLGGVTGPSLSSLSNARYDWIVRAASSKPLVITTTGAAQGMNITSIVVKEILNPNHIVLNNTGLTIARTVYLPSALVGQEVSIYISAQYAITAKAYSGDTILSGNSSYTGYFAVSGTTGYWAKVGCFANTVWTAIGTSSSGASFSN